MSSGTASEFGRLRPASSSTSRSNFVHEYTVDGRTVTVEVSFGSSNEAPRTFRITPAGTMITSLPDGGALLSWVFDSDPVTGVDARLLVRLTDGEADDLVHSDFRSGMLEQFRKVMTHPFGVVKSAEGTTPFFVEPYVSEEEFTDTLARASDDPRGYLQDAKQRAADGDAPYVRLVETFGSADILDLESAILSGLPSS